MAQAQVKLFWTRLAIDDLAHAYAYIAEERQSAASDAVGRIRDAAAMLLQYPNLGRIGRVVGTRELVVPGTSFIVPYRVKAGGIEILAVIHAARRWPEAI